MIILWDEMHFIYNSYATVCNKVLELFEVFDLTIAYGWILKGAHTFVQNRIWSWFYIEIGIKYNFVRIMQLRCYVRLNPWNIGGVSLNDIRSFVWQIPNR